MVSLKKDRKGMIAIIDALVFLTLMSAVAFGLFACTSDTNTEEPLAKTITEQLFDTEVRLNDLCDTGDSQIEPLYMIAAVNLNTGYTESTEDFIRDTLNILLPGFCGYDLTVEYNGHSFSISRGSDRELSSEYTTEIPIGDAGALSVRMMIY